MNPARRADLFTRPEAAAYLGVSLSWLGRLEPGVDGPHETLLGRRVYYTQADLDEFIAARSTRHECSTDDPKPASTGSASKSAGRNTGGPLARAITERLYESSEPPASKPRPQRPRLVEE